MLERAAFFPTPQSIGTGKGRSVLVEFGKTLVGCLTSSKAETRAGAESLLQACVQRGVLNASTLDKDASKLLPAEQRKVRPILESLGGVQVDNTTSTSTTRTRSATPSGRNTPAERQTASGRRSSLAGRSTTPSLGGSRSTTPSLGGSAQGRDRLLDQKSSSVRSRSISRNGRQSVLGGETGVDGLIRDPNFHPLKSPTAGVSSKRQRAMKQRDHIAEYPAEPTSKDSIQSLKKTWASLLPSESVDVLFPKTGIEKQDDATDGCILLSHALSLLSRDGEEHIFIEQLDLVIRWFSIAFCCRDTTSGMESLLSLLTDMVSAIHGQKYQLSDTESSMLLPYILEKGGVAKVSQIDQSFQRLHDD